eukprot:s5957_g7.t1
MGHGCQRTVVLEHASARLAEIVSSAMRDESDKEGGSADAPDLTHDRQGIAPYIVPVFPLSLHVSDRSTDAARPGMFRRPVGSQTQ